MMLPQTLGLLTMLVFLLQQSLLNLIQNGKDLDTDDEEIGGMLNLGLELSDFDYLFGDSEEEMVVDDDVEVDYDIYLSH